MRFQPRAFSALAVCAISIMAAPARGARQRVPRHPQRRRGQLDQPSRRRNECSGDSKVAAIEFYNAGFKHYFVSSNAAEIAKLDNGIFPGWARTGQSFNVYTIASSAATPVCRFFTVAFPPTSSHFYAPRGLGCEGTLTTDKWQYEGDVSKVPLPVANGNCPSGSIPVNRLYNDGQGAPRITGSRRATPRASKCLRGGS